MSKVTTKECLNVVSNLFACFYLKGFNELYESLFGSTLDINGDLTEILRNEYYDFFIIQKKRNGWAGYSTKFHNNEVRYASNKYLDIQMGLTFNMMVKFARKHRWIWYNDITNKNIFSKKSEINEFNKWRIDHFRTYENLFFVEEIDDRYLIISRIYNDFLLKNVGPVKSHVLKNENNNNNGNNMSESEINKPPGNVRNISQNDNEMKSLQMNYNNNNLTDSTNNAETDYKDTYDDNNGWRSTKYTYNNNDNSHINTAGWDDSPDESSSESDSKSEPINGPGNNTHNIIQSNNINHNINQNTNQNINQNMNNNNVNHNNPNHPRLRPVPPPPQMNYINNNIESKIDNNIPIQNNIVNNGNYVERKNDINNFNNNNNNNSSNVNMSMINNNYNSINNNNININNNINNNNINNNINYNNNMNNNSVITDLDKQIEQKQQELNNLQKIVEQQKIEIRDLTKRNEDISNQGKNIQNNYDEIHNEYLRLSCNPNSLKKLKDNELNELHDILLNNAKVINNKMNQRKQSIKLCQICKKNLKDAVLTTCGHFGCFECLKKLKFCYNPDCKTLVGGMVKCRVN